MHVYLLISNFFFFSFLFFIIPVFLKTIFFFKGRTHVRNTLIVRNHGATDNIVSVFFPSRFYYYTSL